MNIQPIYPKINNNNNENRKDRNFTGAFDSATLLLRFLETNQAWGANAVDLCSMVIPRTSVDFINRGPDAGAETLRREASGTTNHSLIGVYGTLAGLLFATGINSKFGIKAHKIFADNETLELVSKLYDSNKASGNKEVLKNLFGKMETLVDGKWTTIDKDIIEDVANKFSNAIETKKGHINKDLLNYSKAVITRATGSENTYRFAGAKNTFTLSNGLENSYNVVKALVSKDNKGISTEDFLKSMKKMNLKRSLLGVGIASAIGMTIQPLNIYLTKKKTGTDGFVGVEGREKDKSAGFLGMKALAAGGFGATVLATMGLKGGLKDLLNKIQFKGFTPTIDQFKLIYGFTIMSRFMSARDKDELREAVVKDVLGFFNWLVLGNFVSKMAAHKMDKTLLNYSEKDHGKGYLNKIIKAPLHTRDEVLQKALKDAGISNVENGKALTFKQMLKKLSDSKVSKQLQKEVNGKLRKLSIAQIAGYLYSGIILGFGIPKLNIYMTNKSEAKRKAKLAQQGNPVKKAQTSETMLKPENLEFLSKQM